MMALLWASLSSFFTPTFLFLLVNLVIGTIVLTSRLAAPRRSQEQEEQQQFRPVDPLPPLVRAPSLLDRVRSINLSFLKFDSPSVEGEQHAAAPPLQRAPSHLDRVDSSYRSEPRAWDAEKREEAEQHAAAPPLQRAPSLLGRVASFCRSEPRASDAEERDDGKNPTEVKRCKSEARPAGSKAPEKSPPRRMKKSASERSAMGRTEEKNTVESWRPATARMEKAPPLVADDEINAKADDFINRFKNQLKLQRLDSILRYKEMLGRGSAKQA